MMDFQNHHGVEDEEDEEMEEEEEEDEDDDVPLPVPATNSSSRPFKMPNETRSSSPLPLSLSFPVAKRLGRYRECLKNHAVGIGGHALDGCCEFMPAGGEGSLDALKCAACNCHRNFHRKEVDPAASQQIQSPVGYYPQQHPPIFQFYPYGSRGGYPNQRPLALPPSSSRRGGKETETQEMILEPMSAMGIGIPAMMKKRHRTKFTAEQKEKMQELAEKVGWRLQRTDEPVIQQFCEESGIKRHVLKVWLHNNKHTLGKIRNPN